MTDFLRRLTAFRRRILLGRSAEAGARGAFFTSLAVCALLAASRILDLALPAAVAWGAIAAAGLLAALRAAARSFTVRDCAILLDRRLGLDERLSTALDASGGAMHDAQAFDAARALAAVVLPSRRLPREAKLLAGSGLLMAALLVLHAPARAGGVEDAGLAATAQEVMDKMDLASSDRIEFREVKELVSKGRLEEAATKLQALADRLDQELLQNGGGAGAEKDRDLAAAGAAALSAALGRLGKPIAATLPASVALKVERQKQGAPSALPSDEGTVRAAATTLERADWPSKYDSVIRTYYGKEAR